MRAVKAAPVLSSIGVAFVVPWFATQQRPEAEYVLVKQVDVNDVAGAKRVLLEDGAVVLRQSRNKEAILPPHAASNAGGSESRRRWLSWPFASKEANTNLVTSDSAAAGKIVDRAVAEMEHILLQHGRSSQAISPQKNKSNPVPVNTVASSSTSNSSGLPRARFVEISKGRFHMHMLETDMQALAVRLQQNAPWLALLQSEHVGKEQKETKEKLSTVQLLDSRPGSLPQVDI
jgi:hypothetical protein